MPDLQSPSPPPPLPEAALLFACILDGTGKARAAGPPDVANWTGGAPGETLWLHLDRTADGVLGWLEASLGVSRATSMVLVSNETRPRAFPEGGAVVTILRGLNFNEGADPDDMIALQIHASRSMVVTLRRRALKTPRAILGTLNAGAGPKTSGDLLTTLAGELISRIGQRIVEMNARIDLLEAETGEIDLETRVGEVAGIRRACLALKRYLSPQHEALDVLARLDADWLSADNRRTLHDTIDRLKRALDDLDVSKESALVLQDDLNNRMAQDASRTMYMLSVVAAIFLPLSFVTGLLGINVGGMPGVGSRFAFWITVGLLAALLGVQLWIFRKLKWL